MTAESPSATATAIHVVRRVCILSSSPRTRAVIVGSPDGEGKEEVLEVRRTVLCQQPVCGATVDKTAVVDEDDVVGRLGKLGELVAGYERRSTALRELPEEHAQPPHAHGVKSVRRLVQDQSCRVAQQR